FIVTVFEDYGPFVDKAANHLFQEEGVSPRSLENLVPYVKGQTFDLEEIGEERFAFRFVQRVQINPCPMGGIALLDGFDDPLSRLGIARTEDKDEEDPVFFHQTEEGFN